MRVVVFAQFCFVVVITMISHFFIGLTLGVWFGQDVVSRWEQVNVVAQYGIALIASSVTVPVGILSFFVSLIANTPLLT